MTKQNKRGQPRGPLPQQPYSGEYAMAYPAPQPPAIPPALAELYSVTITMLSSRSATVAKAVYANTYNLGIPVSANGEAKREPGDDYDAVTGRLLIFCEVAAQSWCDA